MKTMVQALYYKPSYDRLQERIGHAAPDLDVVLIDTDGKLFHHGKPVTAGEINPSWFWIHSEMLGSPVLGEYCQMISSFPEASWLHTIHTGLEQGPYLDLLHHGLSISNNHSQALAISEYVMGHLLSYFQDLPAYAEQQRQGIWKYRRFRELHQTRWVIIGFGHIGQQIARRAKPFGVHITAVRRNKRDEGLADAVHHLYRMDERLQAADVVVLTCASNDDTRGLVNSDFLGLMKEGSVLINVARGDLVVEADLHAALEAGRPAHAILDVFATEPLPEDSWIWNHPRVSMTPHCSNAGSGMRQRSDDLFIENLNRMANGQLLLNEIGEKDIL